MPEYADRYEKQDYEMCHTTTSTTQYGGYLACFTRK